MRRTFAVGMLYAACSGACSYDFDAYKGDAEQAGGSASEAGSGGTLAGGGGKSGTAGTSGTGGLAGSGGGKGGTAGSSANTAGRGGSGGAMSSGGSAGTGSGSSGSGGTAVAFAGEAPDGASNDGHCYFIVGTALSFEAAIAACEGVEGSTLSSITSADEQAVVEDAFFPSSDDLWIGLSLNGATSGTPSSLCELFPSRCPFTWQTDEALDYTNWAVHSAGDEEPNYTGSCVRLQGADALWADFDCSAPIAALCEHEDSR